MPAAGTGEQIAVSHAPPRHGAAENGRRGLDREVGKALGAIASGEGESWARGPREKRLAGRCGRAGGLPPRRPPSTCPAKKSAPGTPKRHRTSLSAATGEVLTRFTRRRPRTWGKGEYRGEEGKMVGGCEGAKAQAHGAQAPGAQAHQAQRRTGAQADREYVVTGGR